ncbi:hypothetical protein [Pseudonocardia spirodelae]|uniref:Uncharacterized protein n=1 Tax=Pseudonocardia spirodelae TaxID=3133431 RepID=A0ABU8TA73_9PSEU
MKGLQSVVGLIGVTLGVIPLVVYVVTGGAGSWGHVADALPGPVWLYPAAVTVVAAMALVVIDRRERVRG